MFFSYLSFMQFSYLWVTKPSDYELHIGPDKGSFWIGCFRICAGLAIVFQDTRSGRVIQFDAGYNNSTGICDSS